MNNYVYQFSNQISIQNKCGHIGLKLTGEIADCIMIAWDKKLLAKLKDFELIPDVYTRFKDDIDVVIETLEKGSILEEDKIVINEEKKYVDKEKSDSKVTMEVYHKK